MPSFRSTFEAHALGSYLFSAPLNFPLLSGSFEAVMPTHDNWPSPTASYTGFDIFRTKTNLAEKEKANQNAAAALG